MTESGRPPAGRIGLRWMIRRNYPAVVEIERLACPSPWDEADLLARLRTRKVIGMVATLGGGTQDERIAGFMVYSLERRSIEVLRLAVHPEFGGRGVGRRMVATLGGKLSPNRRTHLGLDCRETSTGLHLFLRATGWNAVRVLADWYDDTGEAAFRFVYTYENFGMPYTPTFRSNIAREARAASSTVDGGGGGIGGGDGGIGGDERESEVPT